MPHVWGSNLIVHRMYAGSEDPGEEDKGRAGKGQGSLLEGAV